MALVRDVTELEAAESAMQAIAQHHRMLVDYGSDMVSTHATDGRFLSASPSAVRLFGWSPSALVGRPLAEVAHRDDRPAVTSALAAAVTDADDVSSVIYRLCRDVHEACWVETTLRAVDRRDGAPEVHCSTRDVSERKSLEDQLRHRADHDALTEAVSRQRFDQELDDATRHTRAAAGLLLVDLDSFRRYAGERAGGVESPDRGPRRCHAVTRFCLIELGIECPGGGRAVPADLRACLPCACSRRDPGPDRELSPRQRETLALLTRNLR